MNPILILTALALLLSTALAAQQRTRLEGGAGLAATFINKKSSTDVSFSPRILPHAGILAVIPVQGRFSLKTGLAYEQKGWHATVSSTDTDGIRLVSSSTMTLHALTIPLAVHLSIRDKGQWQYGASAGVSYSFFIDGQQSATYDSYRNERLLSSSSASWAPYIALIPDSDKTEASIDGTAYFMFNPSARLEATVTYKQRYALRVFGNYGLTELSTAVSNAAALQLNYCGFTLAVVVP